MKSCMVLCWQSQRTTFKRNNRHTPAGRRAGKTEPYLVVVALIVRLLCCSSCSSLRRNRVCGLPDLEACLDSVGVNTPGGNLPGHENSTSENSVSFGDPIRRFCPVLSFRTTGRFQAVGVLLVLQFQSGDPLCNAE